MVFLSRSARFLFACVALTFAYAQPNSTIADARPAFEVASIKPNKSGTGVDRIKNNGGVLLIENVSLKRLIFMAYDIPEWQNYLLAGPEWLDSENFDIQARFPSDTPHTQFLLMFQRLLDERFRMASHRAPKEFSVLALVRANETKPGPALHPAAAPEGAYRFRAVGGHAAGFSLSMAMLAGRLSRPDFGLDRPVLDYTGLEGTFDLTLDWKPERTPDSGLTPDDGTEASIFDALKEQLGLKLDRRKVSLPVLVIDRAIKVPTQN